MIVCKILQHMIHFPKLTNVQSHLRRAFSLLTQLLFHIEDTISLEVRKKILLPLLKMIQYNKLSRPNKQIISGILEKCKQKQQQESMNQSLNWEPICTQLESTIFDLQDKTKIEMIDVTNNNKQQEESADVLEFKSMIEEVNTWLRNTILKSLNFSEHNQSG